VGEHLRPLDLPEPYYLVVTPPVAVSTGEIFSAPELPRDTAPITAEAFLGGEGQNDCEAVTCARYPQVKEALDWLRQFGPARMSGTGSSVFLPCPSRAEARTLQDQVPKDWHSFVAAGLNQSPLKII